MKPFIFFNVAIFLLLCCNLIAHADPREELLQQELLNPEFLEEECSFLSLFRSKTAHTSAEETMQVAKSMMTEKLNEYRLEKANSTRRDVLVKLSKLNEAYIEASSTLMKHVPAEMQQRKMEQLRRQMDVRYDRLCNGSGATSYLTLLLVGCMMLAVQHLY